MDALSPGFADPVFGSQSVFRTLLDALARPGRVLPLATDLVPPAPLTPELAAVALTLADPDAPLWLDPALAQESVTAYLRFHTGARIVAAPGEAAFALVREPEGFAGFAGFALGTEAYPDRSTTVVLALPDLGGGRALHLTGPGIDGAITAHPPLSEAVRDDMRANPALFPRGIDLILTAPGAVMGLPRSTRLKETG